MCKINYRTTIRDLVYEYVECDRLVSPETRFAKNIIKNLRVVKRRALTIWVAFVINGVIYILISILRPGRHLTEDMYVIYGK